LAGGSELILPLKFGLLSTKHIIDVKSVAGLDHLEFDHRARVLRIGTLVTHRALETSETVRHYCPVLVEMERHVANIRIRNVGTLGGNICFAEPHSDPGTLLVAYKAKLRVRNEKRERTFDVQDLFADYYKTTLEENELLTEIEIPQPGNNVTGTYLRFCPGERPIVGIATVVTWKDGTAEDVRLVLGCVGPTPIRVMEVEQRLHGKSPEEISANATEAGERAALLCDPLEDLWGSIEYKRQIVKILVMRGLSKLCQRRVVPQG
jgi:carbon-monoxide dehydrogenase medium subunit